MHDHVRAARRAIAALVTGALLAAVPLTAHASELDLTLELQHAKLTIPYGGPAPDGRVLVAVNAGEDVYGAPTVDVDAVSASGTVTPLISAMRLDDEDDTYLDSFPAAGYFDFGSAAAASFSTRGLAAGRYTIRATEVTGDGSAGATASAPLELVAAVAPAVQSVSVSRSAATVFPVRDGYRDSVVFSIGGRTTTGTTVSTTGSAVLRRRGHVVQTWRLTSSTTKVTWNGRAHGAVAPGTYTLTVTQRGRTGASRRASTSVVVDRRALVSHSATAHYSAGAVLGTRYFDFSSQNVADCFRNQYEYRGGYVSGAVFCEAYDDIRQNDGTNTAVVMRGTIPVPAAVRRSTAVSRSSVTVGQHTSVLVNAAYAYLRAGSSVSYGRATSNAYSARTLRWSGNPATLGIEFRLGSYCYAGVKDYTVTWHYATLG